MSVLSKGTTFANNDQVTSTKLNQLVDSATFTSSAVDGITTQLSSGKIAVKEINTGQIASSAVTTIKIADSNVTTAKIADDAVTTAKIADDAVTTAKILDANLTAAKLNGAQSGSAPIYGVRAWVNFDGKKDTTGTTSTSNTNRLIRGSGNVSSVLRNGLGNYTITFTTAMQDANYCVLAFSDVNGVFGGSFQSIISVDTSNPQSSSSVTIRTIGDSPSASANDKGTVCLMVIR
jgi:hypothetical protein